MTGEEQPQKSLESGQGLLEGLDGINEPRNVQSPQKTYLEIMLNTGQEIVETYYRTMPNYAFGDGLSLMSLFYSDVYSDVCERLRGVAYDTKEIEAFVLTNSTQDNGHTLEAEHKSMALGLYTGCLAQLLTERNKAQGKRTCIYIDGKGNRFDYLFLFAREVDTIVVENFNGEQICSYICSFNGHAERVIARNIQGDKSLCFVAYNNGNVNQLIGINMLGRERLFSSICNNDGYAEQVVGVNLDCKLQVMRGVGSKNGNINQLIAKGINGLETLTALALNGRINQVVFDEIKGHFAFNGCAESDGVINMIVGGTVEKGPSAFNNLSKGVGLLAYPTLTPPIVNPEKIVSIESPESLIKLTSIWEEVKFYGIAFCLHMLQTAPYNRLLEIADELYALRPAVPEGFFGGK